MTKAAGVDFVIYSNEDFYAELALFGADGTPLDLTNCELLMQVRQTVDSRVLFELSTANGRLSYLDDDPALGVVVVEFPWADISTLPSGTFVQGCAAVEGDARSNIWTGTFTNNKETARWTGEPSPVAIIDMPTGVAISMRDSGGSIYADLSWTAADSGWGAEVRYKAAAGSEWTSVVAAGTSTIAIGPLAEGVVYDFQVRSVTTSGRRSEWTTAISRGLGPELVSNGRFTSDTVWSKGTGWTIGSGVATKTAGTGAYLSQSVAIVAGTPYRVGFDVTAVSAGGVRPDFTGGTVTPGTLRTAVGTYRQTLTAGTYNVNFGLSGSATFAGSVDNVSVRQLLS